MDTLALRVKKLNERAICPTRGSERAAGYDLYVPDSGSIPPGEWRAISLGISVAIPISPQFYFYGSVRSRSGLSAKKGIEVGAGVIDSDYRGEIKVVLHNFSNETFYYKEGDRIAQLILEQHAIVPILETTNLDQTERGEKGFGSTDN
jgi:dUTP pyrophosphatase